MTTTDIHQQITASLSTIALQGSTQQQAEASILKTLWGMSRKHDLYAAAMLRVLELDIRDAVAA